MTSAVDPAILDLAYLRQQTAGDTALEHELLRLFDGQCARLQPLLTGPGSSRTRRDAAHSLRGAASALGALRVAALAEQVERSDEAAGAAMGAAITEVRQVIRSLARGAS